MKKAILLLLVLVSVITLAACGGANAPANNAAPKDKGDHHGKDGDDHGKMTEIGKKKVGDKDVTVGVNEWKAGKEGVAEVETGGKLGEAPKFWAEQDGKPVSPKKSGEWVDDEKLYDCHVELATAKAGKVKFFVEIGGKSDSWDVDVK